MRGRPEDMLVVFAHLEVFGEGGVQSDIHQIAALSANDDDDQDSKGGESEKGQAQLWPVFYPDVPRSVLTKLGYHTSKNGRDLPDEEVTYGHPNTKRRVRCFNPDSALRRFFDYIRAELRKTDFKGAILVFGFAECAAFLMRAVALSQSSSVQKDAGLVKGYCVLESPLRSHYLRNCDGDVRVPVEQAWRIVFGTSKRRLEAADDKAYALSKISKALHSSGYDLGSICLEFSKELVRDFERYLISIEDLKLLRRFVKKELERGKEDLVLRGKLIKHEICCMNFKLG